MSFWSEEITSLACKFLTKQIKKNLLLPTKYGAYSNHFIKITNIIDVKSVVVIEDSLN